MKTSSSIKNITAALIEAEKEMNRPTKDGKNPYFNSRYTTLSELQSCLKPALRNNGLHMICNLLNGEGKVGCELYLLHTSGEELQTDGFFLPVAKNDPQSYGSAATYVQRYAISAFFGIAAEDDDDANAAMPVKAKSIKPVPAPAVEDPDKRKLAIEMINAKYDDAELKAAVKTNFGKESVNFLTLDELRKLYKLLQAS